MKLAAGLIIAGFLVFLTTEIVKTNKAVAEAQPMPSPAESILKGEHELRKMAERVETASRVSGSFFLVVGDFTATTKTKVLIKFAWKMNDGRTYAISSLPLEKIRVEPDEKVMTPTIKFRWRPYPILNNTPQPQELMDDYVVYAVITAREEDWPIQINLPLNTP